MMDFLEPMDDDLSWIYNLVYAVSSNAVPSAAIPPVLAHLAVDGHVLPFEVDSGAPATIIPTGVWQRVGAPTLKPAPMMRSCTRDSLGVRGQWTADVRFHTKRHRLRCIVADKLCTSLCGRDWIAAFDLLTYHVDSVQSAPIRSPPAALQSLMTDYADLFKEELGHLTNYKARIYVRSDAQFRTFKPRPLPYAMRPVVEAELDRLVRIGVLKPTDTAPFGAVPVVPVIKSSGAVRICADFKVGINQWIDVQQYPLPHIDDLLAKLAGGQHFTKIDLADAYLQVELDETAQQYLVLSTHKGLFR